MACRVPRKGPCLAGRGSAVDTVFGSPACRIEARSVPSAHTHGEETLAGRAHPTRLPYPGPGRRRRARRRRVRRVPRGQRGSSAGRSAAQLPAAHHDASLRRGRHDARRVLRRAPLPGAPRPGAEPRPARLPRGRGRGLLPPPGYRSVRDRTRALRQPGQQARRAGRQHHHAAGREDASPHPRSQHRAQGEGGHPVPAPREQALQGRHPLSLPEPDLLRRRRLRRPGRRAHLLRRRRRGPHHRAGGDAGGHAAAADRERSRRSIRTRPAPASTTCWIGCCTRSSSPTRSTRRRWRRISTSSRPIAARRRTRRRPGTSSTCAGCSRSATAARPPRSSACACTPRSTSSSRAWPRSRSSAGCACSIGARASAERCAACRRTRSTRS